MSKKNEKKNDLDLDLDAALEQIATKLRPEADGICNVGSRDRTLGAYRGQKEAVGALQRPGIGGENDDESCCLVRGDRSRC